MGMFDRFKRRTDDDMAKKNRVKNQPVHKIEEVKIEDVPVTPKQEVIEEQEVVEEVKEQEVPTEVEAVEEEIVTAPVEEQVVEIAASHEDAFDQLDLAVAKLMGTYDGANAPKPYSTDKNLVMDMVTFARENKIKLPLFTSDPTKIATAIEKWGKQ